MRYVVDLFSKKMSEWGQTYLVTLFLSKYFHEECIPKIAFYSLNSSLVTNYGPGPCRHIIKYIINHKFEHTQKIGHVQYLSSSQEFVALHVHFITNLNL